MSNIVKSCYPDIINIDKSISFPEFVLKEIERYGDKIALIAPKSNKSYTFAQVIELSRRMAVGLYEKVGLRRRDVLSTCMGNYIELIPLMLGVGLLGATVNTANPAYTVRELVNQFSACRTRFVLTTANQVEKINAVKKQCKFIRVVITLDSRVDDCLYLPDLIDKDDSGFSYPEINTAKDLAFLLNSSGTTGLPKAVMLTHYNLVVNLCQVTHRFLQGPAPALYAPSDKDSVISAFPMFHIGGIFITGYWMLINGTTSIMPDRYDPVVFLEAIRTYKITTWFTPPPVLVHYTKSSTVTSEDFESVKIVNCGGACVVKELSEAVMEKIKPDFIVQIYGMTELSPVCHTVPLTALSWQKHGSCGKLVPSTFCKVLDLLTGEALSPMKRGEICIKGPQIMEGYLNNPKATQETIDSDGWLHTGDIGYYDEDEYFYIVDRIKDIIKVKGFQVAPAELEGILFTHPSIADACVVSILDDYAGELPCAFVVLKPGKRLTDADVKKHVAGHVVSYKRLEGGVYFVDELPKTPSGKLLRRLLRDQARNGIKSKL